MSRVALPNDTTTKNLIATEDVRCKDVYTNNVQSRTNQHVYFKSKLGLMNNQPTHELSVQDKLFIDSGSSNLLYTSGNIYSAHFKSSNVTSSNIHTSNIMSLENEIFIYSNVGILNTEPVHTLDIGANVRIDEYGSNTFHTSGNIHAHKITGDAVVIAGTVSATQFIVGGSAQTNIAPALQTVAEKTPFSADRTMTLSHPTTGVIVNTNVRALTVLSNVAGENVHTTGDIMAGPVSNPIFYVKSLTSKVGINEVAPAADLHVTGNAYVSSNLTVDTDTLYADAVNDRIGINKIPTTALDVSGVATFDDDLIVDTDTLHVDISTNRVGINKLTPDSSLHVVGNAYVSTDFSHGGLAPTSGTEIDQIKEYTKSLNVTATWMDVGISGTDLATGTYIVQLYAHEEGTSNFNEYYSGLMSWFSSATDSSESSEIVLHAAGKDPNSNHTYLRVTRLPNPNTLKLQIRKDAAIGSTKSYEFKFRRMI